MQKLSDPTSLVPSWIIQPPYQRAQAWLTVLPITGQESRADALMLWREKGIAAGCSRDRNWQVPRKPLWRQLKRD